MDSDSLADYRERLAQAILAWFHDGATTEWPGEIDAYRSLAKSLVAVRDVELAAERVSRFAWAEEAAEADLRAVSEQARANVLAWLHAEAVWQRDRLDDEALKWTEIAGRHAEEVEQLRAELAELCGRAVTLPDDWRAQLSGVIEPGDIFGEDDVFALIESWQAAPEPAGPPKRYRIDGPYANGYELVDTADTVLGTYAHLRMAEVERDRLERRHRESAGGAS